MKILGLIPARGGSKGIPNKNIKLLAGKPLIQYAVDAALGCSALSTVVVSTDDDKIAAIAEDLGAKIPFIRPAHLASDQSPTVDTMVHLMEYFEEKNTHYDAICLLQPTSPFRTSKDIELAIANFIRQQTDSLISVIPVPHHFNPHWTFKIEEPYDTLYLSTGEKKIITRRQDLPKAYVRNGAIYLTKTEVLIQQKSIYGSTVGYYEMDKERSVNIDGMEDWKLAEKLLGEIK